MSRLSELALLSLGGSVVSAEIGQWIRRAGQKWHLCESVVAGDVVTRCGRRMLDKAAAPFQVSDVMPLTRMIGQPQLCKAGCVNRDTETADDVVSHMHTSFDLRPEDDLSTAPVDAPDVP